MTSPFPAVRWRRRGLTSVALLAVLGGAVVAGRPDARHPASMGWMRPCGSAREPTPKD
nr:hypothetical protein [Microbacterium barkeri]